VVENLQAKHKIFLDAKGRAERDFGILPSYIETGRSAMMDGVADRRVVNNYKRSVPCGI